MMDDDSHETSTYAFIHGWQRDSSTNNDDHYDAWMDVFNPVAEWPHDDM